MKILLKSGFALALGLLLCSGAQAQVPVYASAPYWGPAVVVPNAQYYYIPEIDGYYDLYAQSYLFYDPAYGSWVSSPVLPRAYAAYDPRFFHPVVIEYVGRQPWGYLPDHHAYCGYWGVQPGRYYGSHWPGRNYVAAPRGGYGPAYYGNRPASYSGYARRNDHDDRSPYYGRQGPNDRNNQGNHDDRQGGNSQGNRQDRSSYEQRSNTGSPGNHRSGQDGQGNRGRPGTSGSRRGR